MIQKNKIKTWIKSYQKKAWITRDFVIAGLLFAGVISFFMLYFMSLGAEYNNEDLVNEQFSKNYDQLSELSNKVNIMRATSTAGEGLTFLGTFDVAFQSTFTVIQLVFSTLALVATMPINMVADFKFIDRRIITTFFILVYAIITAWIVFVWISSISRSKV